jgi:hypothetical protein
MNEQSRVHNLKIMSGLVLLAILYGGLLFSLQTLTGAYKLDGAIGVLLGLYISSHPAKHMVNMVFFRSQFFALAIIQALRSFMAGVESADTGDRLDCHRDWNYPIYRPSIKLILLSRNKAD